VPPILTILGFFKWPATLSVAVVTFGAATNSALTMLHDNVVTHPAQIRASLAPPVIHVPDTPMVTPAATAKAVALLDKPADTPAAAAATPASAGPAQMIALSGLIVRSRPMKASASVGTVAKGEGVEVRSKQGGWVLISGAHGQTGWVFGKYLKPAEG
jgi:hypothetical protein